LLVYAIVLVADFPAVIAVHFLLPPTPGFSALSLRGTVWHGVAHQCRIRGIAINRLEWNVNPWPLLTGTLDVRFRMTTPGQGTENGTLLFTNPNRFRLEGVQATFNLGSLKSSRLPGLAGKIRLRIHRLSIRHGALTRLAGQLRARRIFLRGPFSLRLEPLTLTARAAPNLVSRIHLVAGSAGDLAGTATVTLTTGNHYRLVARIKPEPGAPSFLDRLLADFGQPDPEGFYHARMAGILPPLSVLSALQDTPP
jgi:hypothetical protein